MEATHEAFMAIALEEARAAAQAGDVPVGAVIVRDGQVIARGRNLREVEKNALCHAETVAIPRACQALGGWRLPGCSLYVTLEPCPMCAGAIINARVEQVIFGASDPKAGCCGSVVDLFSLPFNHHPQVIGGILHQECAGLLKDFFAQRRRPKKDNR